MDASTQHQCQSETDGGTACNCVETIKEAESTKAYYEYLIHDVIKKLVKLLAANKAQEGDMPE